MTRKIQRYGWKPDIPDVRDYHYAKLNKVSATLPSLVDLRSQCPSVLDQGELGSCTANSIANCHKFVQVKEGHKNPIQPSRLFIYYNERVIEGTVKEDSGAEIRDGFKTLATQGVCAEASWPYNIAKFASKPTATCYKSGLAHVAVQYQRLNNVNLNELKSCLAAGYPFVYGFSVYESFESDEVARTGIVPLPQTTEQLLGGHAVLCVGYNDATQRFIVMNSWGTGWGEKGFFEIPYNYLTNTNLADDFWTLRLVK